MGAKQSSGKKLADRLKLVKPAKSALDEYSARFADLADSAWGSYGKTRAKTWRAEYYGKLVHSPSGREAYRIITEYDSAKVAFKDVGFCAVLPLKEEIAELHLSGHLSQYAFNDAHIADVRKKSNSVTYHYVQSVWLHEDKQTRDYLVAMEIALCELLKVQNCGKKGREYVVYSETSVPRGRKLSTRQGLMPTKKYSADSQSDDLREFFVFSSKNDEGLFGERVARLWL